eukprot:scaffold5357_cov208-Amphora_coffeaeformis.AAC.1
MSAATDTNKGEVKLPLPPFTRESAIEKIRLAENAWNSKDPDRVKMAYSTDTVWRNRSTFVTGRDRVQAFLQGKWEREHEYRLIKELWAFTDNRIAVRFCYEYHNDDSQWFRAYGNENWLFNEHGLMKERHASINDVPIAPEDRKFHWTTDNNVRPDNHPGLSELGL